MKIISWNVNGIRAWLQKKNTVDFIVNENPDIFCLQEVKAMESQIDNPIFEDYKYQFWNSAERKGYSGTVIFTKQKPISVSRGIGHKLDNEGRVITVEFGRFYLVNVYTPNSKPDLSRLGIRYKEWDRMFLTHLRKIEKKKPVIICGDLNVAHQEIDLKNPSSNKTTNTKSGNAGFTDKERKGFSDFLEAGFVDTWRFLHPDEIKYSWWSYRFNARNNNAGWRIDYFLISKSLKIQLKSAEIYDEVYGSDHCPVGIDIF